MRNSDETRGTSPVQSVDRAISVLELLARNGEAGITEIAEELGVHKSTASRLVGALEARGLVEQLGERGKYAIGFGIVRLAGAATGRMDLAKLGNHTCQSLADSLGETVNIAVADDGLAINISQAYGSATVTAQNWTGRRTPLHATSSGKVLLAFMETTERRKLLHRRLEEYTPRTTTAPDELGAELDRIVEDGYAACFEEFELGMHAVAVPIFGSGGDVIAAISASGPSYRLSRQRIRQLVRPMSDAAAELSGQLGHIPE
ncbi:IclR family transcriptional regulator [Prauserella marina]|uniref:Glycerol operon regulatory protein n=1 Tax=Prauserella marina TaxID=530584 RepID=A0A222VVG5_9PSEU|nr:IclR family transcriptional regulator [Prauserella marina]ASR37918.1 IclR family transcriptional regulator [Prauserella marina]PWV73125.1 IclR family transcriptional regulator [Prauserella marina]SDD71231.1 CRISPR locus-related DNA-binding protein [Prauserella marina]